MQKSVCSLVFIFEEKQKLNEGKTKQKKDENKRKLPSFSLRSEMKQIRNEIFFALMRVKCFFARFRV
jgi:hypothetical protein